MLSPTPGVGEADTEGGPDPGEGPAVAVPTVTPDRDGASYRGKGTGPYAHRTLKGVGRRPHRAAVDADALARR